ncbi:putative sensor with HAMP domain [Candidatus Vecturithrix granuli]|uniref:histidine kinase n=1 Tax=Vecturithrix granuli TaxID=1499967 RepID=A0A081C6W1_VECG1|nr:putative sensor with HAMP domain [Candidatus Vecturithrix granuli]
MKRRHIPEIHFSIREKIFFIILIPSLLLLLIIVMDYHNLTRLGQSAELILSKNYKSIQAAQKVRQRLEMTRNQMLLSIFKSENINAAITPSDQEIADLLEVCRNNITEPGEQPIVTGLFRKYATYQQLLNNMTRSPANAPPLNAAYLDFISLTAEIVDDINALVGINEQAMERAERETKDFARTALRYSIGLMIVALLSTIILSYLLSTRISSPLTTLAKTLSTIQEGSGSYPEIPVKTRDEIGFLTSEFNRLFTRLKEYDRESADKLLAEKEKVHQAEIAKAQFIADLSHQLKTPMTSLNMGIGILAENPGSLSSTKQKKLVETAKDDCTRLSALINELVDIARLEAMVKPREHEVLDIERVTQECIKPLVHQAEQKQVAIEVKIEPGIPPISLDSLRFPWVITNLIGNAIRYTNPGGQVAFHVYKQEERLFFQCRDTGIGIEEKYLSKIFQRYSQFSEREKSGTIGLGLAIVKEIVEQHGGSITVESQVHQGTTFTFWIPLSNKASHYEERPHY